MNPWLYFLPLALWGVGACIIIVWCAMCSRMSDERFAGDPVYDPSAEPPDEWAPEPMRPIVDGVERDPYPVVPNPAVHASGATLDAWADVCGLQRKPGKRTWRTLWLVRRAPETDAELRERVRVRASLLWVRDGVL